MIIYIIQRRLDKRYQWLDYWQVGDLNLARKMIKSLQNKYREEFRLIREYKIWS